MSGLSGNPARLLPMALIQWDSYAKMGTTFQFLMPGGGSRWDPLRCVQCSVDARLAEPCAFDDRRHGFSRLAQRPDLLHPLIREFGLASELHASVLGLGNAIPLALTADVILELGNKELRSHRHGL